MATLLISHVKWVLMKIRPNRFWAVPNGLNCLLMSDRYASMQNLKH
jgi:hypothetical protein